MTSRDTTRDAQGTDRPEPRPPDRAKPDSAGGPTGPAAAQDAPDEGPETGGYDDHSPDRAPRNEKGGYGTG